MTQAERVEFVRRHRKCRSVTVDGSESVCLNCIWYEQYYYKKLRRLEGLDADKQRLLSVSWAAARPACPALPRV